VLGELAVGTDLGNILDSLGPVASTWLAQFPNDGRCEVAKGLRLCKVDVLLDRVPVKKCPDLG
jgi:hypothetical protein